MNLITHSTHIFTSTLFFSTAAATPTHPENRITKIMSLQTYLIFLLHVNYEFSPDIRR